MLLPDVVRHVHLEQRALLGRIVEVEEVALALEDLVADDLADLCRIRSNL
jgi:hypothetical protein